MEKQEQTVDLMIDQLVGNGLKALSIMETWDQKKVDHIIHQMAIAALDAHMLLAELAIMDTNRGVYEDKAIKNMYASESIYNSIKNDKTVGVINEYPAKGLIEIATPVGVICGIIPTTNPTSTTIFKALISMKTRNPIIFAFHPQAQRSSIAAAQIVLEAAVKAGAPVECIQWIKQPSKDATATLMNHEDVALVLATGGKAMVKAAYSTGKPALGVGPGNTPVYMHKSAMTKRAVNDIIVSKTFDNGMICASEQGVIVDKEIYKQVKDEFLAHNVYFVKKSEIKQLEAVMMNESKTAVNGVIVGKSAREIAQMANINVPEATKMLIVELDGSGFEYPLSLEKLSPVLAMIKADNEEDAFKYCTTMLETGLGHTAVIHSEDQEIQLQYGLKMKACRILVNAPAAQGGIGDLYNEMIPSLTLGCGSYGHNSVSKNVSTINLINTKILAKRRNNMQWFKVPPKIYYEENSLNYLEDMDNVERVFLVCDEGMVKLGYVDRVIETLKRRQNEVVIEIFSDVEPDPSTRTVEKGYKKMAAFEPDTIIALGGGSPMDAAKAMWMFYENPDTSFFGAKQKFLDIRKRTYKIKEHTKAKLLCIPTTSGTGSEVTPFAVITDSETHIKYPLADYALTPNAVILDPQFVLSVPKHVAADTGMDVLTHAIEAFVSVMASDYTRALSLQAIKLVFENLEQSCNNPTAYTREKMHNASALAGMAFANAFLGINHSIAHKVGSVYPIAHGRINAILMPHVIRYNAKDPQKHAMYPKYDYFRAHDDYAEIAKSLNLKGKSREEYVEALISEIENLALSIGVSMKLSENGVSKESLDENIDEIAKLAYTDQCTTANPKEPLISELKEIILAAF